MSGVDVTGCCIMTPELDRAEFTLSALILILASCCRSSSISIFSNLTPSSSFSWTFSTPQRLFTFLLSIDVPLWSPCWALSSRSVGGTSSFGRTIALRFLVLSRLPLFLLPFVRGEYTNECGNRRGGILLVTLVLLRTGGFSSRGGFSTMSALSASFTVFSIALAIWHEGPMYLYFV